MKTAQKIGLILTAVLLVFGLVCTAATLAMKIALPSTLAKLVLFLFLCFYAVFAFQKPHGNMLRYLMFIFAISMIFSLNNMVALHNQVAVILYPLAMVIVGFISGRLNKIEKNGWLALVVLALLLVCSVETLIGMKSLSANELSLLDPSLMAAAEQGFAPKLSVWTFVRMFDDAILWLGICAAYFSRYGEHQQAGIDEDAEMAALAAQEKAEK